MYVTFVYINLVKTPFLYTNVKLESSIDPYAFEYKSGFKYSEAFINMHS